MLKNVLMVTAMLWLGVTGISAQDNKIPGGEGNKPEQLGEVTVVASRTVKSADGYVTTLRGSDIVKGKPVMEALKYLPLVSVEQDVLKINGLAVSEIWVDGVKIGDRSELKDLPADMIDKVQVTYLSGADKNTTKLGGSIRITLRRVSGYSGSIGANASARSHIGLNRGNAFGVIRGRYGKWSFYNYTAGVRNTGKDPMTQHIVSPDHLSDIKISDKYNSTNFSERISVGYDFSKNTELKANYNVRSNLSRSRTNTLNVDMESMLRQRIQTTANEGTLIFRSKLNDNGTTLRLIGDYLGRVYRRNRDFSTLPGEPSHSYYKTSTNMWNLYGSLLVPVTENHVLTVATDTYISSEHYRPESDDNGGYATENIASNSNLFSPQVSLTAQGRFGMLQYSAGGSWKMNRIEYEPLGMDGKVRNTQSAFNPTVQLRLPFSRGRHALSLSYKHVLGSISYSMLTPVVRWEDPYNYIMGNPDLKASTKEYVGLIANLWSGLINLTAAYNHDRNIIMWETFADPDNSDIHYSTPTNNGSDQDWLFGADLNMKPVRQWRFKITTGLGVSPQGLRVSGNYYGKTRLKQYYRMDNTFAFGHGWGGELTLFYEPTFKSYNNTYHYVYQVYGNVYKQFLKNTLLVTLDFWPVDRRRIKDTRVGDQVITQKYSIRNTSIGMTVRWRFNGGRKVKTSFADGTQDYEEITDTDN